MEALALKPEYFDTEERRLQARYDLQTQFSELVDGSMHTELELSFDNIDLYGPDGRSLNEVTLNGLKAAKKKAKADPNLWFGVRRAGLEREERNEALEMARGKGPNTMMVLSDSPPELEDATEDIDGYNVTRRQTMKRIYVRQPNGVVRMHTQSLDSSNRQALEAIYDDCGFKPEPGELLGQRIRIDLTPEEQELVDAKTTGIYDQSMTEQFNEEFYAGRRPADYRNTYDFVCKQQDIIETFVELQLAGQLSDSLMYSAAATMQKRFEDERKGVLSITPRLNSVNIIMLFDELEINGRLARQLGKSYSACGETLRPDGFSTEAGFEETGLGSKDSGEDCTYISKKCPNCGTRNVKTRETKTHISGDCGCSVKKTKKAA
jgi:hypothetical protein